MLVKARKGTSALDRMAEMTKLLIAQPMSTNDLVAALDCYPDAVRRYVSALESKGLLRRKARGTTYVFIWVGGLK